MAQQDAGRRASARVLRRLVLGIAVMLAGSAPYATSQARKSVSIDDDPILGDANAKVTIVEFSDYQCEFCRIFWKNTFPQLRQHYIDTGKVRLVYRDFPQSVHPEATIAAIAAECAADQGKYWEYHDKVFSEQDRRGKEREVVRFRANDLKRWAAEIGLEATEFNRCLDLSKHKREVAADRSAGADAGVNGTPAFFINGRPLIGAHPFATFQRIIEEELRK